MSEWKQYKGGRRWRVLPSGEIEVEGLGIPRTGGEPETMRRLWEDYSAAIRAAHARWPEVHMAWIMATIAVESARRPGTLGRDARSLRLEPGYVSDEATPHKVSPGLMQTLISTARWCARWGELPDLANVDREGLFVAETSILLGTTYMAYQLDRYGDPMLADAAYNAGSVRTDPNNPFGWTTFHTGRAEHWARWVGDACAVLRERGVL